MHLCQANSQTGQLFRGQHAIGSRSSACRAHELVFALEEIKFPVTHSAFSYKINHLPGCDRSGIRHIISSERDAHLPAKHAGFHELLQLRDGICRVQKSRIPHQFRKIIARVFELVERNAHAPDEGIRITGENLPHPVPSSRCRTSNCSDGKLKFGASSSVNPDPSGRDPV